MVSPVGMAQTIVPIPWHRAVHADESHPNIYGSYLAAVYSIRCCLQCCENPLTFVSMASHKTMQLLLNPSLAVPYWIHQTLEHVLSSSAIRINWTKLHLNLMLKPLTWFVKLVFWARPKRSTSQHFIPSHSKAITRWYLPLTPILKKVLATIIVLILRRTIAP